jgi:hypothetical protein
MLFDLKVSMQPVCCPQSAAAWQLVLDLTGEPDIQRPAKSLREVQADAQAANALVRALGKKAASYWELLRPMPRAMQS